MIQYIDNGGKNMDTKQDIRSDEFGEEIMYELKHNPN